MLADLFLRDLGTKKLGTKWCPRVRSSVMTGVAPLFSYESNELENKGALVVQISLIEISVCTRTDIVYAAMFSCTSTAIERRAFKAFYSNRYY